MQRKYRSKTVITKSAHRLVRIPVIEWIYFVFFSVFPNTNFEVLSMAVVFFQLMKKHTRYFFLWIFVLTFKYTFTDTSILWPFLDRWFDALVKCTRFFLNTSNFEIATCCVYARFVLWANVNIDENRLVWFYRCFKVVWHFWPIYSL